VSGTFHVIISGSRVYSSNRNASMNASNLMFMDDHKLTVMHAALFPTHYVLVYKTLAVSLLHTVAWTCLDRGNYVNALACTLQGHAKCLLTFLSRSMIVPCSQALGRKMAMLYWGNSNSLIGAKCDKRGP